MARARPLEGADGDAAGGAARVGVHASIPLAWARLCEALWMAVTDPDLEGGSPDEPRASGPPPFPGDDAARVEALVQLAQQGDADAFGQLYERSVTIVYRYLYVRTGDRQLTEDLTSETFVRALRRIDTFTWQGRDIVAWFLTIARNLVADTRKSAHFRLEITNADLLEDRPETATTEDLVIRRHHERELVDALRTLTSDQAECVVLRFMEGLSLAEVAEVLGRKENAVKQLQLRAMRALRKELDRAG